MHDKIDNLFFLVKKWKKTIIFDILKEKYNFYSMINMENNMLFYYIE
jgi:hypothetical protein